MNALIYDIEILKAVPAPPHRDNPPFPDIEFCAGWHDHVNMGVACICAYDYVEDRYRVFTKGNFEDFLDLTRQREPLVGFNNIPFDNSVIEACLYNDIKDWIPPFIVEAKCYDLLREIWRANGLGPVFVPATHSGYGLDAVAGANGLGRKTGAGALAPVWWQQGQYGRVVDYCLNDCLLQKKLFDLAIENKVKDPQDRYDPESSGTSMTDCIDRRKNGRRVEDLPKPMWLSRTILCSWMGIVASTFGIMNAGLCEYALLFTLLMSFGCFLFRLLANRTIG